MNVVAILRGSLWQIGVIVAVFLGIVAAISIRVRRRPRRELSYEVLIFTPVLGADKAGLGQVKILFNDRQASNPLLLQLRFANMGSTPIFPADYVEPLSILLSEGSSMFAASVVAASPPSLSVHLLQDKKRRQLTVRPCLLNPRDAFTLQLLMDSPEKRFDVLCKVAGLKNITARPPSESF
jgi:hypothetical protein